MSTNGRFTAPGHNCTIRDDAGQDWIIYHAREGSVVQDRDLMLDRIVWKDGWPTINGGRGPSWTSQPAPVVNPSGTNRSP
jgi:arabinan endo-1,5-alpha-L-arabinosidase